MSTALAKNGEASLPDAPMTDQERSRRDLLESIVREHIHSFWMAADALAEIRRHRLYRDTHGSFADYCGDVWDISAARGYQLVEAARVRDAISTVVEMPGATIPMPENESQVRPLSRLTDSEVRDAWQEAVLESDGEVPTGPVVERAAERVAPKPRREPAKPKGRVEHVGPSDADEDAPEEELSDEEWLGRWTNPKVRSFLRTSQEKVHDEDALLYRRLASGRDALRNLATRHMGANRVGKAAGLYQSRVSSFLLVPHPRDWLLCSECVGQGEGVAANCQTCKGRGYVFP